MEIKKFLDKALSFLFVKDMKCIYCNKELNEYKKFGLCDKCFNQLTFNDKLLCRKCGIKLFGEIDICAGCVSGRNNYVFTKAISVMTYEDLAKKIVKKFKFGGKKFMGEYLSKFLYDKYIESGIQCDIVMPVPMYKSSLTARGYNQAYELCNSFHNTHSVKNDVLIKIKKTGNQARLNYNDRKKNLINCFSVENSELIKNKSILLIDDIFTTGNTVNECSRTLKKYGAKEIYVLTLCSGVNRSIEKMEYD